MDSRLDDNPYAPPPDNLGAPLGTDRYYGLVISRVKFSDIIKLSHHPLVWLFWMGRKWLVPVSAMMTNGIVNPRSPQDLQIADLDSHIKSRFANQHAALQQAGFRFVGFYNGPAFGLGKNIGEVWVDHGHSICLNLLIQSVTPRRKKQVLQCQALLTWLNNNTAISTSNIQMRIGNNPGVDGLLLPGMEFSEMIQRHRERLPDAASIEAVDDGNVWQHLLKYVKQEVQNLQQQGLLAPVSGKQLARLIEFSDFIDFRERTIPWFVRFPLSLKLPIYFWLLAMWTVSMGYPTYRWAIVAMPIWWLFNNLVSFQVFRYLLRSDPADRLPPRDYFHYLKVDESPTRFVD